MTEYHIATREIGTVHLTLDGHTIATFGDNNTGKHLLALCLEALGNAGATVINDDTGNTIIGDIGDMIAEDAAKLAP